MIYLNKLKHFLSVALLFIFIGFPAVAQTAASSDAEPDKYVQAYLIADKTKVQGGETIRIGLIFDIYPEWHVYWKNPGDSGTAPEINWALPPGFSVSALEFPTPKKIPFGPLTNYGHENAVIFMQDLTLPPSIAKEPFMIQAKVNLLVCHEICIPENHRVAIMFNGSLEGQPENIRYGENLLPVHKDWPTTFYEKGEYFIIEVTTDDTTRIRHAKDLIIFPEDWGAVNNSAKAELRILDTGFEIIQKRGERNLTEIPELPFVLSYINSSGTKNSLHLIAQPSEKIAASVLPNSNNTNSAFGLWKALLFSLLGGIILNLMPCVFPVLSMKALSLINLKGKEENKARGYGLSYTAGILASFAIIGGALLLLKAGGAQIGWGFQLQSPIVIILLTYLVFIIGLNFSGLFEFSSRFGNLGSKLAQQSGNRGAFFTGVLATLVATPCTAPFMGAAMGYALTQPAYISMMVFLALGFGLALPYLALCYIPALRAKLPKPGHWMETFRQFLAFPMFITTAWLVWVLSQQIGLLDVFFVLLSMIAIVFLIWLIRVLPAKGFARFISQILIVLSLVFIITLPFFPKDAHPHNGGNTQTTEQDWENFTAEKLTSFLEQTDDPIFVNMTASWCITCQVNEKIALSTSSIQQLFKEKNITYLKGDWTNGNAEITQYLNSFNRQGVPIYVYYGARDAQTKKRPNPVVLPQLLTPKLVEKIIRKRN